MHNLSQIDTFAEAMLRIKDMNILQHELKVMKQPYTDRELIAIHAGKLRGDIFKEVNYKWLQQSTRPTHSKPSLSRTTLPVPVAPSKVDWSWDDYCDDIGRHNNTDNTVRTKSTVLLSKGEVVQVYSAQVEADIEARVMSLYHQRFGSSPPGLPPRPNGFPPHKSYGRPGYGGPRTGRWQRSQFPQSGSPYPSQFVESEDQLYRSQVPAQSPYRSQFPTNSSTTDPRFSLGPPPPPPRFDNLNARGRGHEKRKSQNFTSSPSKRAQHT